MPKKLKTLAKNTDKKRKARSEKIKVKLTRVGKKKPKRYDHWNIWFMFKANSQTAKGKKYGTIIQTIEDIGITKDNYKEIAKGNVPMMVHCGCPDYKFRWEVANQKKGNSMILNSNGKLPKITNPEMKQKVCKHVLACIDAVKQIVQKTPFDKIQDIKTKKYYD